MAQSDARFGYKANLSRDAHDLSQSFGFSTAPGMLNPIFADIASPGDSYYIKHDLSFLRTAPLAAPAMVDVKVHYESFFVPMQMLYQPFENTFFSLRNAYSSNFNDLTFQGQNFPVLDYWYCISQLVNSNDVERSLAFRLCDLLDLNALNLCNTTTALDASGKYLATEDYTQYHYHPNFFPWQILAYNTIYAYFYRLDDKEAFQVQYCNFDKWYNTSVVQPDPVDAKLLFYLYQRPWDFDYFTSSYRSPIVSTVNTQGVLSQGQYSDLLTRNTQPIGSSGLSANSNTDIRAFTTHYPSSTLPNIQGQTSTALIRQAFANEKLAMITGRTRKNYDSQVLAHFGVKVPHDVKHDITLIGHDTYQLRVGEVTSLASTSDSALGDLAGKGFASGEGKQHEFTAPCHGVIMTIFSIEPMQRYYGGFNRSNAISSMIDLPVPEYDRLGNQPVYQYEAGVVDTNQSMTNLVAWKERYYQWKRRKPRVSIGFWNPANYQGTGGNPYDFNNWEPYFISSWAYGARGRSLRSSALLQDSYYIQAECMDALMLVPMRLRWGDGGTTANPDENWNKFPHLLYAHDPFIVDSDLKVKKVSWMSKDGEPVYPF